MIVWSFTLNKIRSYCELGEMIQMLWLIVGINGSDTSIIYFLVATRIPTASIEYNQARSSSQNTFRNHDAFQRMLTHLTKTSRSFLKLEKQKRYKDVGKRRRIVTYNNSFKKSIKVLGSEKG